MTTTKIEVEWSSQYSGKEGMARFLECIGGTSDGSGEISVGQPLFEVSRSLADFLSLASVDDLERFSLMHPSKYDSLRNYSRVDYDVFMIKQGFRADRHFDYSSRQDPAKAATGYFADSLIVIGKESNGSLYLLNPMVQASDGEWEAWLYSWRLPGAYRFSSFAELLAHLYQETQYAGKDNPRFGFSSRVGECVRNLVKER